MSGSDLMQFLQSFSPDYREKLVKIAHVILVLDRSKERGCEEPVREILSEVVSWFWYEKLRENLRTGTYDDVVKKLSNDYGMPLKLSHAVAAVLAHVISRAYTNLSCEHELKVLSEREALVIWRGRCDVALIYGILKRLGLVRYCRLREICEIYNTAAQYIATRALQRVYGEQVKAYVIKEKVERDLEGWGTCIERIGVSD